MDFIITFISFHKTYCTLNDMSFVPYLFILSLSCLKISNGTVIYHLSIAGPDCSGGRRYSET